MTLVGGSTIIYLIRGKQRSIILVSNHAYHNGGAVHYVDDYTEDFGSTSELIINKEVAFTCCKTCL